MPSVKVEWPKIKMPEIKWKPSWGRDKTSLPVEPKQNPVSKALDKVSTTSKSMATGVRNAWGSAVSKLSTSKKEAPSRVATREEPGFWTRLFGLDKPRNEPQTVQEFLAQDRPGTTRR